MLLKTYYILQHRQNLIITTWSSHIKFIAFQRCKLDGNL